MADDSTGRLSPGGYQARLVLVNEGLTEVLPARDSEPRRLHAAMWHAVFGGGGGKRLRPVIVLTVGADFAVPAQRALPAALALELVHDYSLVHDDLPCMDDAAVRRGAPSVHAAYGYADAVLVGDALLTLAFEVLGRGYSVELGPLVVRLAEAAGAAGMVGGQHADLDPSGEAARCLPGAEDPTLRVHLLKTARLFEFAFAAGALVAARGEAELSRLASAGVDFGMAFQIADDIRDAGEDDESTNVARALGAGEANELAHHALDRCLRQLADLMGPRSETLQLIRAAAVEMALGPPGLS